MTTISEDEIRELAYFKWLEEGCPEGRAEQHWLDAVTVLKARPEAGPSGRKVRSAVSSARAPARSPKMTGTKARQKKAVPA